MDIKTLSVGQMAANCYLISDSETNQTIIIDPGDEADFISNTILENKLEPTAIYLTHGHFDHCLACLELSLIYNIPIHLHPLDNFLYQSAHKSSEHWQKIKSLKLPPTLPYPDDLIFDLKLIHTPGHTPGSICLYNDKFIITGDTIFADGIGDTSHRYSNPIDLNKSISKILSLPENLIIYSGHGSPTTIQEFKTAPSLD